MLHDTGVSQGQPHVSGEVIESGPAAYDVEEGFHSPIITRGNMDYNDKMTACDFPGIERIAHAVTMRNMDEGPHTRLKQARIAAGYLTATQFSDRHGFSQSGYSTHEKGSRPILRKKAEQYGPLLGVSPSWIMFGGDPAAAEFADLPDRQDLQEAQEQSTSASAPETGIAQLDEIIRRVQATLSGIVELANRGSFQSSVDMIERLEKQVAVAKAHCVIAAEQERERAADFIEKHTHAG